MAFYPKLSMANCWLTLVNVSLEVRGKGRQETVGLRIRTT